MRRCEFERPLRAVRDCGIDRELEALLRPTGVGGRPRTIDVDVFLAGIIATVLSGRALTVVNVHRTLTVELSRSFQVALGLVTKGPDDTSRLVGYHTLTRLLASIDRKLRAHADVDDYADTTPDQRLYAALQRLSDLLLDVVSPDRLRGRGSWALDGTGIDSFAKGTRRLLAAVSPDADHAPDGVRAPTEADWTDAVERSRSWDDDAQWGYRTKTYDNRSTWVFGYHAFAMVSADAVSCPEEARPFLVQRIALRPANADASDAALTLVDSLRASGHVVSELLNDREFSFKTADKWAVPLRERGIEQVHDLHPNDRGPRDFHGVLWLDGAPHCPSTPERLHVIAKPSNMIPKKPREADPAEAWVEYRRALDAIARFGELIAERRQYVLVLNATKDSVSGKAQFMCPAQAGKLRCANNELSTYLDESIPEVENPPVLLPLPSIPPKPGKGASAADREGHAAQKAEYTRQAEYLKVCRQPTLVIPGHIQDKLRQRHYWGSPEWFDAYKRRVLIEGIFGTWKNPSAPNVKRGWIRVVGIVKTMIMLSCFAAAQNIQRLRAWAHDTGDVDHWLLAPDPDDFGWEERETDIFTAAPHAPPTAA